ncbi:CoA-transferase [Streptomyces sp. QTS137]
MGAFQVPATGAPANWRTGAPDAIPAVAVPAVGGAMGPATGAGKVFVRMTPLTKSGVPKLVPDCTCPLTGSPGCAASTASARTSRSSASPPGTQGRPDLRRRGVRARRPPRRAAARPGGAGHGATACPRTH